MLCVRTTPYASHSNCGDLTSKLIIRNTIAWMNNQLHYKHYQIKNWGLPEGFSWSSALLLSSCNASWYLLSSAVWSSSTCHANQCQEHSTSEKVNKHAVMELKFSLFVWDKTSKFVMQALYQRSPSTSSVCNYSTRRTNSALVVAFTTQCSTEWCG